MNLSTALQTVQDRTVLQGKWDTMHVSYGSARDGSVKPPALIYVCMCACLHASESMVGGARAHVCILVCSFLTVICSICCICSMCHGCVKCVFFLFGWHTQTHRERISTDWYTHVNIASWSKFWRAKSWMIYWHIMNRRVRMSTCSLPGPKSNRLPSDSKTTALPTKSSCHPKLICA